MKKLLLTSLAVCIAFLSQDQIKKGQTFLYGSIGYSHQTNDYDGPNPIQNGNPKYTSFNFTPSIGWAIRDNLVFGIDLGYNLVKNYYQPQNNNDYSSQSTYKGGVFLRKYKYLGSGFSLFGQTNLDLSYSHTKYFYSTPTTSTQKQDGYGIGLAFYPGVAYTINRHWQIETGFPNIGYINYNHSKYTYQQANAADSHTTTNSFNVGSALSSTYQFTFGLLYII